MPEPLPVVSATGRRKTAVARVRMKPGTGQIRVNGRSMAEYFPREVLHLRIQTPFEVAASGGHRGEPPYSYVYDNLTGRLDHALLSPSLADRLVGAAEWHTNADEPDSRGYQEAPEQRGPWRSSDHDPLALGFRLRKP